MEAVAYGKRRHYFTLGQLDSVMNYPWRKAILRLFSGEDDGRNFRETVETILENYPSQVIHCNMNLLGSHDTPEALPRWGAKKLDAGIGAAVYSSRKPLALLRRRGRYRRGKDPYDCGAYPLGREDKSLVMHYRSLGNLRKNHPALRLGSLEFLQAEGGRIAYTRTLGNSQIKIYVNLKEKAYTPQGRVLLQRSFEDCGYVITEE